MYFFCPAADEITSRLIVRQTLPLVCPALSCPVLSYHVPISYGLYTSSSTLSVFCLSRIKKKKKTQTHTHTAQNHTFFFFLRLIWVGVFSSWIRSYNAAACRWWIALRVIRTPNWWSGAAFTQDYTAVQAKSRGTQQPIGTTLTDINVPIPSQVYLLQYNTGTTQAQAARTSNIR